MKDTLSAVVTGTRDRAKILGGSIALLWVVNLVDTLVGHRLAAGFGIHPRALEGLWGILFAPFLHANWAHLIANTTSLAMIAWIVMLRKKRDFFVVGALSALTAGLGTWLVGGANTVHIGASGVVFGFLGYVLSRGFFERKILPIVASVAALVFFGGALRGLFPGIAGVSWEGHLFGFLGGILAARLAAGPSTAAGQRQVPVGGRARVGAVTGRSRIGGAEPDDTADEEIEALRRKMGR